MHKLTERDVFRFACSGGKHIRCVHSVEGERARIRLLVELAESPSLSWPRGLYPNDAISRAALLAAIDAPTDDD